MRPTFDEHGHEHEHGRGHRGERGERGDRGDWRLRRRGGRMRRGEIRTALLTALAEDPGHGYEIMQRLEEKSEGAWRPSPGSVYPTLQMLEDEGLVRSTEREGKRVYELTDAGRTEATRRAEEAGGPPWESGRADSAYGQLREGARGVLIAARQLSQGGNESQVQRAADIVRDARKQLYRILAED